MQFFYKWFVSEKEVLSNLPLMPSKKLKESQINNLIKSIRKLLFFRKLKNFFGIVPTKRPKAPVKIKQDDLIEGVLIFRNHPFSKNEMFCAACLTHESFFTGGGSWSPDFCPTCKDVNADVTFYKKLTIEQKHTARKEFDKMWEKYRRNV